MSLHRKIIARSAGKVFQGIPYFYYKNKVFITADGEPEELYVKGDSKFEFQRCISRLHEMRSKEYL